MRLIIALLLTVLFLSCNRRKMFTLLSADHTGIHFNNRIIETDSINPLNNVNIYNGGGVGIGDFNGDSLPDIYFTGNMVPNKLYLNKGNMKFEDVTVRAKVSGEGRWCRGASVVDINADGRYDLYVSASMNEAPEHRRNLLYINQGNDATGIPQFKEQAAAWGLDDTTHTTMALFFDYDNDNDLDLYLVINQHLRNDDPNRFRPIITDGSHPSTGRLYRNDWIDSLGHRFFTDVSAQASITTEGYSHAGIITDINRDGWKDIYVTNDFLSANVLYINNKNGTFSNQIKDYFKQTSTFAMGVDVGDINNDGWTDLVELDMNPQDNYRKKMMLGANSYQTMQNFDCYGYQYQYSKNSLQLNAGPITRGDSAGPPVFSQIAYLAGVAETDWSWTPLLADYDNDGFRDLMITNGYPKDVTDRDFMTYRDKAYAIATTEDIMRQIPEVKLHNYMFRNSGNLTFSDESAAWGFEQVSFSNGAATADLDADGDLDIVVNNINDEAFIYRNNAHELKPENHFLNIELSGEGANKGGFGAWISVYYDNQRQVHECTPYRGYLSSSENKVHFGLGVTQKIDSLIVVWPDACRQSLTNIAVDQTLRLQQRNAGGWHDSTTAKHTSSLFSEVTAGMGVQLSHQQKDFVDFNVQRLLPHKLSAYAPPLAGGDVDGDGADDIVCGGTSASGITALLQRDGGFISKKIIAPLPVDDAEGYNTVDYAYKDAGLLLFDADGDGDQDLYTASGGYEHAPQTIAYQDRLYVNDGAGNFRRDSLALPQNFTSKSCVRAADVDSDGDLDLFVAGRVDPWRYPRPVSSFLLRNDSKTGAIRFTDITATAAPALLGIGMVCDALFSDMDNDGWPDLILAGEWMPITFLRNTKGNFEKVRNTGVAHQTGWWNSLAPGDFDNDGDIDYIAGNAGWNSYYKASEKHPIGVTAADFDDNGSYDAFMSLYLPASQRDTGRYEFPAHGRDDVNKQMISMRSRFLKYRPFALATMQDVLTAEERTKALRLQAVHLGSALLRNDGKGHFAVTDLPVAAQMSVLCGMVVMDADGDGNLDVVINGNDYGTDVSVGRHDALNGLLLKGDGNGGFQPQTIVRSGIYMPGDGKALVRLLHRDGRILLAASQHNGPLRLFAAKTKITAIPFQANEVSAIIRFSDGGKQKQEAYFGNSFLSQSSRKLLIAHPFSSVEFTNTTSERRVVKQSLLR